MIKIEDRPYINVGHCAEQDKADDDEGQEGQDEEGEHLLFANNEIHGGASFLSGCFLRIVRKVNQSKAIRAAALLAKKSDNDHTKTGKNLPLSEESVSTLTSRCTARVQTLRALNDLYTDNGLSQYWHIMRSSRRTA